MVKAYMAHQERLRKMEFLSHDKKRLRDPVTVFCCLKGGYRNH